MKNSPKSWSLSYLIFILSHVITVHVEKWRRIQFANTVLCGLSRVSKGRSEDLNRLSRATCSVEAEA